MYTGGIISCSIVKVQFLEKFCTTKKICRLYNLAPHGISKDCWKCADHLQEYPSSRSHLPLYWNEVNHSLIYPSQWIRFFKSRNIEVYFLNMSVSWELENVSPQKVSFYSSGGKSVIHILSLKLLFIIYNLLSFSVCVYT